jgi:hypothetical protein
MPWWAATPVTALFAVAGAVGLFIAGWKRYWTGTADALFRISWKLKSWRLFGMGIEETLMLLGPLAMLACVVHSVFFVQRPDYPQWLLSLLKVPK